MSASLHEKGVVEVPERLISRSSKQLQDGKEKSSLEIDIKLRSCDICTYTTMSRGAINSHKRGHKIVQEFKCSLCPFWGKVKRTITKHEREHHSNNNNRNSRQAVKAKKRRSRFGSQFSCKICGYITAHDSRIRIHQKMHQVVKKFKCASCPFWSSYQRTISNHEQECHKSNNGFQLPLLLLTTENSDHPSPKRQKTYNCKICCYATNHDSRIRIHRKMHEAVKKFKCSLCPFYSSYLKTISNHEATCHIKIEVPTPSIAKYSPKFTHDELGHTKFNQGQSSPVASIEVLSLTPEFTCSFCNLSFDCQSDLESHDCVEVKPDLAALACQTIRKYPCPLCEEDFDIPAELQRHSNIHPPPKPQLCNDCSMSFCTLEELRIHQEGSHPDKNELPFKCELCQLPKSFALMSSLAKHVMEFHVTNK